MQLMHILLVLLLGALNRDVAALGLSDVQGQISTFAEAKNAHLASGCNLACFFLDYMLPGTVSFPNSTVYEYEESRYWSQQQALTIPTCRVSPACAEEVSITLLVLRIQQCQFAVKSGGHAAFTGASNINGGITIDLVALNQVTVSSDQKQTSIGPGNRWVDVYSKLEPRNLSVIGGRVADIGVGGLTLGGGISFFSGRYGWACDNVINYEVVFADGTIHNVNLSTYPDLYFALRGGGNNFGIVTRFDVVTFEQGEMWGGSNTYLINSSTTLLNAFESFDINAPSDAYAAVILAYAYVQQEDVYIIVGDYQYGKPVVNPPILQNFTTVPAIASTMRITNLTDLTIEFNNTNPGGFRQTYWALMTKNNAALMADIVSIFQEEVINIKNATNVIPSCVFQPITVDMTSHFSQNGGNALGISVADGPLNLINIDISWSDPADDKRIFAAARNIINRANATAYSMGLGFPYIYQNYAAAEQPVFASYGASNYAKLKAISEKYDPAGVFIKLQPGYFKI